MLDLGSPALQILKLPNTVAFPYIDPPGTLIPLGTKLQQGTNICILRFTPCSIPGRELIILFTLLIPVRGVVLVVIKRTPTLFCHR